MTTLQFALVFGLVIGAGVAGAVYALVPAQPDLADVLGRLAPASRRRDVTVKALGDQTTQGRVGIWAERRLPAGVLGVVPAQDLAVLQMTPAQFYGKKVLAAMVGLVLPALVGAAGGVMGVRLPFAVPVVASLVLGVTLYLGPSRDVSGEAKKARTECARALTAFVELCALERNSGAGAGAAMTKAAQIGDSWLFRRIREELALTRYTGRQPWDALEDLAQTLGLVELREVANIMRLAGDENARAYTQLRARAESQRSALLSAEVAQAGQVENRMYLPAAGLFVVFTLALLYPPLMVLMSS